MRQFNTGMGGRSVATSRQQWYYVPVIADFADQGTEDIFYGVNSAAARRTCPVPLHPSAWKKLERVNAVDELAELAWPPGNRLEALRGDRRGQHSIRINDQYRICFVWDGADARAVEIVDYHG